MCVCILFVQKLFQFSQWILPHQFNSKNIVIGGCWLHQIRGSLLGEVTLGHGFNEAST